MEITHLVDPLSACEIEMDSAKFLMKYQPGLLAGERPLDVIKLLDDIFQDNGFSLLLTSDTDLPKQILGLTEMNNKTIKIRESDYIKCDTDGYPRMTVTHEVGHARLHHSQFLRDGMKMCRTQSNYIPPYRSAEWQARVWASATMMPFPAIVNLINESAEKTIVEIIDTIMERFIVSRSAAEARYGTIVKYKKDGRYDGLEKSMKKLCKI